jgi:lysine/ornithine N-monooxygenase
MNKRIKLLAEQARQEFLKLPTGYTPEQVGMYPQLMEKFAELIVRECAQACINMGNEYEIKSAGQYQAELFAFAIKQHFGVEE